MNEEILIATDIHLATIGERALVEWKDERGQQQSCSGCVTTANQEEMVIELADGTELIVEHPRKRDTMWTDTLMWFKPVRTPD